jgi:hypothetical protein
MIWILQLTFISLKLALNLIIFSIFFFQLHHQITAQEIIFSHARPLEKQSLDFYESNKPK